MCIYIYIYIYIRERNVFVLCAVMRVVLVPSGNSLVRLDEFRNVCVCRECYITEHNQAVRHSVYAERCFRLRSTGQIFMFFTQISWLITVISVLYLDQFTFIPRSHKRFCFTLHFNIILKFFHTYFSCSLYSQKHKCSVRFLHKPSHIN